MPYASLTAGKLEGALSGCFSVSATTVGALFYLALRD
jgi:hypothetical protein